VFHAHAFDAERKNCDSRSYFLERLKRDNSIAIDPVETGFSGAGTSRETPFFLPAGETRLAGGSRNMDETPPESRPGFA